jgi:quercetin dioxygenase-like cupin family protein
MRETAAGLWGSCGPTAGMSLGRPISQDARDGIDRSCVGWPTDERRPTRTTLKGDSDLGGSYADTRGLRHVRALPEEQISEKVSRRILSGDQGMIVWWSIGAGVHVEPHSHPNEQIVWMLKGKIEFRLGSEQRVCGPGDVVVIPGGAEHEAWFREDTEVIDFFAPPREDFLLGGKLAYISEG